MRAAPARPTITALIAALCLSIASTAGAQAGGDEGTGTAAVPNPDAVQAGRRLYTQNCSHCHGFNMVNPGTVSYDLRKFPLDAPDRFMQSVREGKGNMPAWKNSLTADQVDAIWAYVQSRGKP